MTNIPTKIEAMSRIWDVELRPTRKLVLLALADEINDASRTVAPSINVIAQKVCVSRSQAQRIVHGLIEAGLVSVIGNIDGGAPGSTRQYRLNFDQIGEFAGTGSKETLDPTRAPDGSHGREGGVAPTRQIENSAVQSHASPSGERALAARDAIKPHIPELEQAVTAFRAPEGEHDRVLIRRLVVMLGIDPYSGETWGQAKARIWLRLAELGLGQK